MEVAAHIALVVKLGLEVVEIVGWKMAAVAVKLLILNGDVAEQCGVAVALIVSLKVV